MSENASFAFVNTFRIDLDAAGTGEPAVVGPRRFGPVPDTTVLGPGLLQTSAVGITGMEQRPTDITQVFHRPGLDLDPPLPDGPVGDDLPPLVRERLPLRLPIAPSFPMPEVFEPITADGLDPVIVFPGGPWRGPVGTPRSQLVDPVAPAETVSDADLFTDPLGGGPLALPRYALATERVGSVDEPRILITDRLGTDTLVVTLLSTPGPASGPGVGELPHAVAVSLKFRVPVVDGGAVVQELPFPVVLVDAAQTTVTAELPLTSPGLRQQLVAALGSLDAGVTLVARRGIRVAVPIARFTFPPFEIHPFEAHPSVDRPIGPRPIDDRLIDGRIDDRLVLVRPIEDRGIVGRRFDPRRPPPLIPVLPEPTYLVQNLLLDWTVPPTPLVLSAQHLARLGGGDGGMAPMARVRVPFGGRSHSYWQDPAHPERYLYLPDRLLLARSAGGSRAPLLRVYPVRIPDRVEPGAGFEFSAQPVVDEARIAAALPVLAQRAQAGGGTGTVELELLSESQPLLRLALPRDGAPSAALTDRPGTEIDLERGLVHAEAMTAEDFQQVYAALFGASLSMLRGEVRVGADGPAPEDIPLELRLDDTTGRVLGLVVVERTPDRISVVVTNAIESPVRIDGLGAVAVAAGRDVPLRVDGLAAGTRLAPDESVELTLVPAAPLPEPVDAVALDESGVVVEPDRATIWDLVFDRSTDARLVQPVEALAVPQLFASAERPGDRVAAFLITVQGGGTATLTPDTPSRTVAARMPIEPLLTGRDMPPLRYRTETAWESGGIGTSPWREAAGTVLLAVRTDPA